MLDLDSDKSIYIQIAEMVENSILSGELGEGEQAPSTNEFARIYGINPATARKGLNLLVDENILFTRRGLGMFVCKGARERILQKRQKKFLSEVLPQIVKEASRLEISLSRLIEYMEECKEGEL